MPPLWNRATKNRLLSSSTAAISSAGATVLMAIPDLFLPGVGLAAIGFGAVVHNSVKDWSEKEDTRSFLRRRSEGLLRLIATLYPDDTLQLTLFVPGKPEGGKAKVIPFLRYSAEFDACSPPDTKIGYILRSESSLINDALRNPNNYQVVTIPFCPDDSREKRKGYFMQNMGVSHRMADLLSDRTLMRVRAIADVAVTDPLDSNTTAALLSISTTKSGEQPLVLDDEGQQELRKILGFFGILFAGLDP